ncbi:hypothetical protein [Faecalibacter bovis]|uniref:Lipoprotein n=1 Tax=Faecalibacter bovis TaxID=2898187 RepID=A0ABX7XFS4_9FLAO|nr:hypothetical protein [Faecalibacter bovis]QTV06684.1 hypothetical protein J9309_05040 [Faecalibacter bovis]
MKKFVLGSLFISSLLMLGSCNNDKKEEVSTENSASESKGLVMTLEGVFPTNDTYQIFYSNDGKFTEDNSVKVPVIGQPVLQKIVVELPENAKPQNLRLDYGFNQNQTVITVKNIEFTYLGNSFEVPGVDFYGKYFVDGQGTSYDPVTLSINIKPNPDGNFDPNAVSTDELKKNLNKLYNQAKEAK